MENKRLSDRLHQAESTVKSALEKKEQLQAELRKEQQKQQQLELEEGSGARTSEVSGLVNKRSSTNGIRMIVFSTFFKG